jgi:hypothetical protein
LDVGVAVRLDTEKLIASVGQDLADAGREHLAPGRIRDLDVEDGGASAIIADPGRGLVSARVGVIDGVLTGECDCIDDLPSGLCGHAVGVALAALDEGFVFSSILSRNRGADPDEQRFAEIAAGLTPRSLIGLVARQAVTDPHFAALLLARAGQLPPPGPREIHAAQRVVQAAVAVPNGHRWNLNDIVKAGRAMAAELKLLAVRPPTDELLTVVEEAITVWATVSGHLLDAWDTYETEPEEIGTALADVHLQLCQTLQPDPLELAARLATLVANADTNTYLDLPDGYADVLGPQAAAELTALLTGPC